MFLAKESGEYYQTIPTSKAGRFLGTTKRNEAKVHGIFSECLHLENAVFAGELIDQKAKGKVIQVTGFRAHRLNE